MDPVTDGDVVRWKYEYELCPVNYIEPAHRAWLGLYQAWRAGFLFVAGGIGDQPAKYIDVMQFCDAEWNKHEAEQMEAVKSKPVMPKTQSARRGVR